MTWITLACIAALFKSLATISEKELLVKENASDYISGISFIIAICSIPLLYFVKDFNITGETFWIVYGLSLISVVDALAIAYVVQKIDISESSTLFATTPIIVALFGSIFIGEFFTQSQIFGIVLSSFGLFILEYKHKVVQSDGKSHLYLILIIGLVFFGLSAVGDRYVIHHRGVDPLLFLLMIQVGICINMFAFDIIKNAFRKPTVAKKKLIDGALLTQKSFWANVVFIISHRVTHIVCCKSSRGRAPKCC
ncbi:MAG: DMT family transporter [Candidatus Pacebacteria bacterium]|nr:DMT family transporter [Candidatus Paceibacterota bacterium]